MGGPSAQNFVFFVLKLNSIPFEKLGQLLSAHGRVGLVCDLSLHFLVERVGEQGNRLWGRPRGHFFHELSPVNFLLLWFLHEGNLGWEIEVLVVICFFLFPHLRGLGGLGPSVQLDLALAGTLLVVDEGVS